MYDFWELVVRPLLGFAAPAAVVEIGAGTGAGTRLLAALARQRAIKLHVVDPAPAFDPRQLGREFPGVVSVHRRRSLDVLDQIGPFDVALIDGDHNHYTVLGELRALQRVAQAHGTTTPLALCHDVCWPYGRRDLYYEPDAIPAHARQPWRRAGIVPGRAELVDGEGLNAHLCNAVDEGGPGNGVLTAVEDFVADAGETIAVQVLPVLFGLAILLPGARAAARPELAAAVDHWSTLAGASELALLAERLRCESVITVQRLRRAPS